MRRKSAKSAKSTKSTKSATPTAKRSRLDRAFESEIEHSQNLQHRRRKRANNNGVNMNSAI